jgi:hypothetical protein
VQDFLVARAPVAARVLRARLAGSWSGFGRCLFDQCAPKFLAEIENALPLRAMTVALAGQ